MATIKEHCCGADLFFDKKTADKKYRQYLKKGPSRVTSKIIQQLEKQTIEGTTMIDVGGGIGALQWWFLANGGTKTTDIDASTGYLQQARNHAEENGWSAKASFVTGDCTEAYDQLDQPDYITLDKVVCCYPNYKEILESTCDKSEGYVSLSYPMDGFVSETINWFSAMFLKLKNNSFQPYVHPVSEIRKVFNQKGYKRVAHQLAFPWHVETYKKMRYVKSI